jgi:ankyrin repeat protein
MKRYNTYINENIKNYNIKILDDNELIESIKKSNYNYNDISYILLMSIRDRKINTIHYIFDHYEYNPNVILNRHTTLYHAIDLNDLNIFKKLVENGGDVNYIFKNKHNSLTYSLTKPKCKDISNYIYENTNIDLTHKKGNKNILFLCAFNRNYDLFKKIVESKKVDINDDDGYQTILMWLFNAKTHFNQSFDAVRKEEYDYIDVLLDNNVDINKSVNGVSALLHILRFVDVFGLSPSDIKNIKILLYHGALEDKEQLIKFFDKLKKADFDFFNIIRNKYTDEYSYYLKIKKSKKFNL